MFSGCFSGVFGVCVIRCRYWLVIVWWWLGWGWWWWCVLVGWWCVCCGLGIVSGRSVFFNCFVWWFFGWVGGCCCCGRIIRICLWGCCGCWSWCWRSCIWSCSIVCWLVWWCLVVLFWCWLIGRCGCSLGGFFLVVFWVVVCVFCRCLVWLVRIVILVVWIFGLVGLGWCCLVLLVLVVVRVRGCWCDVGWSWSGRCCCVWFFRLLFICFRMVGCVVGLVRCWWSSWGIRILLFCLLGIGFSFLVGLGCGGILGFRELGLLVGSSRLFRGVCWFFCCWLGWGRICCVWFWCWFCVVWWWVMLDVCLFWDILCIILVVVDSVIWCVVLGCLGKGVCYFCLWCRSWGLVICWFYDGRLVGCWWDWWGKGIVW